MKFRAQRISDKKFVYGSLVTYTDEIIVGKYINGMNKTESYIRRFIINNETNLDVSSYENEYYFTAMYEVIPETAGQFTGLFDKNGKEIYEGDIIFESTDGINTDWKIRYDVSLSQYRAENIGDECDYIQLNAVYLDSSEIIGNIHDNPELLSEK